MSTLYICKLAGTNSTTLMYRVHLEVSEIETNMSPDAQVNDVYGKLCEYRGKTERRAQIWADCTALPETSKHIHLHLCLHLNHTNLSYQNSEATKAIQNFFRVQLNFQISTLSFIILIRTKIYLCNINV